jgi:hypothetical protein
MPRVDHLWHVVVFGIGVPRPTVLVWNPASVLGSGIRGSAPSDPCLAGDSAKRHSGGHLAAVISSS